MGAILVFDVLGADAVEAYLDRHQEEDATGRGGRLLCAACGHAITRVDRRIERNGAHHHRLTNPLGIVFRVGCFSRASGCAEVGEPTEQWSWFQGYFWRIALCGGCGIHLGWSYDRPGVDAFHGLILDRLKDGS